MKKAYETPKVEKMTFDYSDVVVASKVQCIDKTTYTNVHHDGYVCEETPGTPEIGQVGT